MPPIGIILYFSKGPIGAGFKVFLEARRNIDPRHATKWSRPNGSKRLGGKSASQGRFSESHITNQRRRSGRGGFSTDSTWLSAEAPWPKLSVYSGGCWRTPTPMILAFMRKKSMGEQGTRKQCLELYLCFVSAQLMNCRGRGGTDFYRFLCLRLVRSGTVADRATPRAPAPKGTFRSNNRH